MCRANIEFPLSLIGCLEGNKEAYFINTDTFWPEGYCLYASMKKAFTTASNYFIEEYGIRFLNMRLEHIYGPGDSPEKFIPYAIKNVLGENPLELTPGAQKRDFTYVDDVVDAYIKALGRMETLPLGRSDFEIGTGKSIALKDFIEEIKRQSGKSTPLLWGKKDYRENEIMESHARTGSAESLLGWKAKHNYCEGIKKTLGSF